MSIRICNGRFVVNYCMLLWAAVAAFLLAFSFHVKSFAFENEPTSFRGIVWLTPASKVSGLKLLRKTDDTQIYIRSHDPRQVGAASIRRIKYVFEKSRLTSAEIEFRGKRNFQAATDILKAEHGPPEVTSEEPSRLTWMGQTVSIVLEYWPLTEVGTILYMYGSLDKETEKRAEDLKAAKQPR